MVAKTNSRQTVYTGYRTTVPGGAVTTSSYVSLQETRTTEVGPGDNGPFSVERITRKGGLMTGGSNSGANVWSGYPFLAQASDSFMVSHLSMPAYSDALLASEVLKRTSPSRSSIESTVSGAELRELPGLVRDTWGLRVSNLLKEIRYSKFMALKAAAKINLMIQFGIAPMVSDAVVLLDFQGLVNQRVRELERLRSRGLRRTINLRRDSLTYQGNVQSLNSNIVSVSGAVQKCTTQNIRGHARWRVTSNFIESDSDLRAQAYKSVLGAYIDPVTVYNLLPWSWLIDYFTNLGNLVDSSRNGFDMTHDTVRLMTHTKTSITSNQMSHNVTSVPGFRVTALDNTRESKSRRLASATLVARETFLSGSQTSILGSLAVTRLL